MERDPSGIQYTDVAFCPGSTGIVQSRLLATAVSARVDVYNLYQPQAEDGEEPDTISPSQQIFKFNDPVTSLQFREDGALILTGESAGRVQLFELKNKFALR